VLHASESLDTIPAVLVVVGTTKTAALRFPHTTEIRASASNGLVAPTVFLGFQVQAVDRSWIELPPIGRLADDELMRVEDAVLDALGFDRPNEEERARDAAAISGSTEPVTDLAAQDRAPTETSNSDPGLSRES
jgi:mRNA-degrading endonuclease toxin of MazEF toxin-antitoxin module